MRSHDPIEVKCPNCMEHALFVEPFEFSTEPAAGRSFRRWGGWYVLEKYPNLLPWRAPKGDSAQYLTYGPYAGRGYRLLHQGVVECRSCGKPFVHTLTWPEDAWWQWSIRGKILWAWDRRHAQQILQYVRATHRPPRTTSGAIGSVPSHFLSAKLREMVLKLMERKLGEIASSTQLKRPLHCV